MIETNVFIYDVWRRFFVSTVLRVRCSGFTSSESTKARALFLRENGPVLKQTLCLRRSLKPGLCKVPYCQSCVTNKWHVTQWTAEEVPSTVLTGFWKFRETLFCEPTCFCFRIENVSLILAWRRMVYIIYVSTCFNTAWISGKKLWRKLFLTNTFRPVTHQLRYTWWLAV